MTPKRLFFLLCVPIVVLLVWSDPTSAQLLSRRACCGPPVYCQPVCCRPVYCPPVSCCPAPQPACGYYPYNGYRTARRFGYYPPSTVVQSGSRTATGQPTIAKRPAPPAADVESQVTDRVNAAPEGEPSEGEKEDVTIAQPENPVLKGLVETAQAEGNLDEMLKLAESAGLLDEVKGGGPYTIFAPSNEALGKMGDTTQELAKNSEYLRELLFHHAISDVSLKTDDLVDKQQMMPLVEPALNFTKTDDGVRVNDALIIKANIECTNGMLHIIDGVLAPPQPETPQPETPQPETPPGAADGGDSSQ